MQTLTLRADSAHIFAVALDRLPLGNGGGSLGLVHQMRMCQKLIDNMLAAAKEYVEAYEAFTKDRGAFITEQLSSEEFQALKGQAREVVQLKLDAVVEAKFGERAKQLEEISLKDVTFEAEEAAVMFVKTNWQELIIPNLSRIASRKGIIMVADAFGIAE
jgi:tRNA 2-selenouridine synthase SelU